MARNIEFLDEEFISDTDVSNYFKIKIDVDTIADKKSAPLRMGLMRKLRKNEHTYYTAAGVTTSAVKKKLCARVCKRVYVCECLTRIAI